MGINPRFMAGSGHAIFTGNELLMKGALEVDGGVSLMTGYPGSPVAGFFDCMGDLAPLLLEKGVRAFQANNEALAVASINGSQMAPIRSIVAFKSVGTHVAADALALGNLAGANAQGGALVISGEDPWCESTQVPTDSRFLFEHLRMPVVEPGTPQELKDWINLSFYLSRAAGLYIGYIVTVAHADGGGTVICRPNQFPTINTQAPVELVTDQIAVDQTVLLPPRTWMKELLTTDRFRKTMDVARKVGINRIYPAKNKSAGEVAPLGFITTGMGRPYLMHILADLGLAGEFPVLNMGMSYPADVQLVAEFSKLCKKMVVIEERRSFLEKNIRDSLFQFLSHEVAADLAGRLYGKRFPGDKPGVPDTRGLNASVLAQILIPLIQGEQEIPAHLRNGRLSEEMALIRQVSKPKLDVIGGERVLARTPTFCPGCPHRDSSSVLLEIRKNFRDPEYMRKNHGMGPVDMVCHGDTGCYTMLMFQPTESLMHNYSGMGLGGGTGSGIDPFITNKQLVFMGDGTFFHSGQIAISNSIKANQDLCYIILENKTTAMTGHQEHAGTELDVVGNRSYIQDIEQIVRGMAGTSPLSVVKLSPADRDVYKHVLERTILAKGVKVIIADKECGITRHRKELKAERQQVLKHGYLPTKTHMNVTPEVCENCLECTKQTACPGLVSVDTDYGRKIDTDLTWCVNDGACERVRTSNEAGTSVKPCPSFEQVTVVRNHRRRYTLPPLGLDKLDDPQAVHDMSKPGSAWRVHLAGVGGMGIGVVSAILVRAGHKEGYRVAFQERKGLAIRNGGVFSQITFIRESSLDKKQAGPTADGSPMPESVSDEVPEVKAVSEMSSAPALGALVALDEVMAEATLSAAVRSVPDVNWDYPTTGSIPFGRADLLLGVDVLEAARAVDAREPFRVASPDRTAAVLNMYKQATISLLLGKNDFDPDEMRQRIYGVCREDLSVAMDISSLCERRLGSKQYANIMMLGLAYQQGLIPVSSRSMAWAIKDTIRREQRRNIKAFNIGRKLALEPRALPRRPAPETWEQVLTNKGRILRRDPVFGRKRASEFDALVNSTMPQVSKLGDSARYDLVVRIYDLLQYANVAYARRYINAVLRVYAADKPEHKYAATSAAIINLAKVMLIKDEPYVAYLLTRPEKKQRDINKYNVDVANGDKLVYRHHTSPEFNIGPWRIRLKITTADWQLKLVRQMKWWRKLPGWHKREVSFREWYAGLLDRVNLSTEAGYEQALRVLKCCEEVTGYREIRYPKMQRVMAEVESELSQKGGSAVQSSPKAPLMPAMTSGVR